MDEDTETEISESEMYQAVNEPFVVSSEDIISDETRQQLCNYQWPDAIDFSIQGTQEWTEALQVFE